MIGNTNRSRIKFLLNIRKLDIFKSFSAFMSGTFIFVLASSVAQILVARMVGVENMGIVKVAIIFENYSAFLSFGLGFGLSRQLPLMLGRGESDSARELLNTVWQWFNLVRV